MSNVFVGMSGGIDSSVAAFLLRKKGHDVTGITFTAVNESGVKKCCSIEEIRSARKVCEHLGIPHRVIDLKDIFRAKIIQNFIESYKKGDTPNPCVLCNRFIKFGALLEYSLSEGAEHFATGHYARIVRKSGGYFISRGKDAKKDQSYFLSYIEKDKLQHILLPLGGLDKPAVRKIAVKAGLPIDARKPESQDICFIQDDYRDFLALHGVKEKHGEFILNGKKIGIHKGVPFYSFGQRRGLNIAAGERVFIREIDAAHNRIVLGEKPVSRCFTVERPNVFAERFKNGTYDIQVRYQSRLIKGKAEYLNGIISVELERPAEIVAPGQFAVFYRRGLVAASGPVKTIRLL